MRFLRSVLPALLVATLVIPTISVHAADKKNDELAGAILFRDKGCAHCHGEGGVGTQKAPALVDLHKNKDWTSKKITNQILNGGQKMPPFADSLSDPEIAQIVAYLRARHMPATPPKN